MDGIKEKLKVLKTDPRTIDGVAKIFWAAENEEDVELMQKRLSIENEIVYSHFKRIMEIKPEISEEAKQKLGKLGRRLSPTFFEEFFSSEIVSCNMCCDLHPKYDAYSQEFIDFYKAAYQFALNKMKEYLGVEIIPPVKRSPLYEVMYHTVGKIIGFPSEKGPFIGEIKEKSIPRPLDFPMNIIIDSLFFTDSSDDRPKWNIRVEDKKGEIDLFSYMFRGNSLETRVALDKEFNIGDRVRIERYSNGSYSYPVKHDESQLSDAMHNVVTK